MEAQPGDLVGQGAAGVVALYDPKKLRARIDEYGKKALEICGRRDAESTDSEDESVRAKAVRRGRDVLEWDQQRALAPTRSPADLPAGERLTPDDVASVRVKASKLLVYDEDRYGLFHDNFRVFLVGEQKDPIAEALEKG